MKWSYLSRSLVMSLIVALFSLLAVHQASEVSAQLPSFSAITVLSYEAGVPYQGAVGTITTPCSAGDYSVTIDWGEQMGPRIPTNNVTLKQSDKGFYYVDKAIYSIRDKGHAFVAAGVYTVTSTVRVHCVGVAPGTYPYPTQKSGDGVRSNSRKSSSI